MIKRIVYFFQDNWLPLIVGGVIGLFAVYLFQIVIGVAVRIYEATAAALD